MGFYTFTCCYSCCCVHWLQFGTTASQTSTQRFSLQCLSLHSGVALLYSAGLFSTSVIISHCQKSWSLYPWCVHLLGTADEYWRPCGCFAARAHKQVRSFVFHCHRQPLCGHRTAQKMKHDCVWKNATVKQPPVSSLAFKTERFISAVKKTLWLQPLVCAGPNCQTEYSQISDNSWGVCYRWKLFWRMMQRPPASSVTDNHWTANWPIVWQHHGRRIVQVPHNLVWNWIACKRSTEAENRGGRSSSNDSVTDECRVGNNLVGSSLTVALFRNLSGRTEKNHETPNSGQPVSRTVD